MGKSSYFVFYKPGCSKCRTLLQSFESNKISCELLDYIAEPPSAELLEEFLNKSGLLPSQIVRKSETIYSKKYAGKKYSEKKWLEILLKNPILIQRPLVIKGNKAWVARDEETINTLIHQK